MSTTRDIEAALAALAFQDPPNYSATAEEYNVNRSTLSRRHRGITRSVDTHREYISLLSNEQQTALVNHINTLSEAGIPPTPAMVRVFAWEISQNWPGNNWVARFVHDHRDTLRSAYLSGFDMKRKRADNFWLIKKYFETVSCFHISLFCAYNLYRSLRNCLNTVSSGRTATT